MTEIWQVLNSPLPQIIQSLDTILSLLMLVFTYKIWKQVENLRKSFISKKRLPEIKRDLEKIKIELNNCFTNWPQELNAAKIELQKLSSTYSFLVNVVPSEHKEKILGPYNSLIKFNKIVSTATAASSYWDILVSLDGCMTSVTQIQKDIEADTK